MPSKLKAGKAEKTPKSKAVAPAPPAKVESKKADKKKAGKATAPPVPVEVVEEDEDNDEDWVDDDEDESSEDDEDDEFDGVDEEGMKRLIAALGEDGLDEFDQAQVDALHGEGEDEDDDDEEDSEAVEGEDASDDEEAADENSMVVDEQAAGDSDEEAEDEDDDAIALDEVDDDVDEDAIPRRKVEIDNTEALARIRGTIALDPSLPWTEVLTISYPNKIEVDVNDDLNRELAFYKQALHGANEARKLAAKHKFPFTRPADYFAEMVKSDAHMERIRQRLLDEKSSIKKSEDKRKEREGKKFGKQVQIEKLKEREKSKKEMEEKIKGLKRKRKDMADGEDDGGADFDVRVENALSDKPAKRSKLNRDARDKKYGFGGAGRRSKSNTRESTDDFVSGRGRGGGRGGRGGRGGARGGRGGGGGGRGGKSQRPGKSKRQNSRSKA